MGRVVDQANNRCNILKHKLPHLPVFNQCQPEILCQMMKQFAYLQAFLVAVEANQAPINLKAPESGIRYQKMCVTRERIELHKYICV